MKMKKKKQKQLHISTIKIIFAGIVAVMSAILTFISYVPRISLEIESPSDYSDYFSAPLIVSNNSLFPLAGFSFSCAVWDIGQSRQTSLGVLNPFIRVKLSDSVSDLQSGGKVTIQNRIIQVKNSSLKKGMLQVDVEYHYYLLPLKKFHQSFKFAADRDGDGHFRWLPI